MFPWKQYDGPVPVWNVTRHSKTKVLMHRVAPGLGYGWMVPVACTELERLKVGASVNVGVHWFSLCDHATLIPFETAHGRETLRWKYNERIMRAVRRDHRARLGSHGGFSDVFAPIVSKGEVAGTIVVGPFSTRPPSAHDILDRWRWLTGEQGNLADPEFRAYLHVCLGTLRLQPAQTAALQRLVTRLAALMASEGRADILLNEVHRLGDELARAREADRMWELARGMLDERSLRTHYSAASAYGLALAGLERSPDQTMVGLIADVERGSAVDQAVARYELQRACTELARDEGEAIAGQVGANGVVFLLASRGALHKKRKLNALAERASRLARRRFGMSLHFGASSALATSLDRSFQAALAAAEVALTRRVRLVIEETTPARGRASRALREEVARAATERADHLPAAFDRYVEAAAMRAGHRIEGARAELEICFQRVADTLLRTGALDQRGFQAMCERLDRSTGDAATMNDLSEAYRTAVHDLAKAARSPVMARQDRGLRGALEFIHQHFAEALPLDVVAKASGYSRDHFSALFKAQQGVTFERYLFRKRLDRARELLTGTDMSVTRIAELSGFGSAQYFCRVFRRAVRSTPLEYRRRLMPSWAKRGGGPLAVGAHRNPLKSNDHRPAAR
jgi:AraC-like DNA-binding protein